MLFVAPAHSSAAPGFTSPRFSAANMKRGAQEITAIVLLSAPEGIKALEEACASKNIPITLVTGALDEKLNEKGYIVPGLGDAGDRLYGVV